MLLLPLLAFLFASLLVAAAALALSPGGGATIERRLGEVTGLGGGSLPTDAPGYDRAILDALKRFGNVAPKSTNEMGKLQRKLVFAGYRAHEAVAVFFGIRLGCALLAFVLAAFLHPNLPMALTRLTERAANRTVSG